MYLLLSIVLFVVGSALTTGVLKVISEHGFGALFYPPLFWLVFYICFFIFPSSIALPFHDSLQYRYVLGGYSLASWIGAQAYAFFFVMLSVSVGMKTYGLKQFLQARANACSKMQVRMTRPGRTLYFLVFILLPLVSLAFAIIKFGGAGYADYMLNRTAARKGMGYLLMPSSWFAITLTAFFLYQVLIKKKYMQAVWWLMALAIYTAAHLYLGSKSRGLIVVAYCILVSFFYLSLNKRISFKKMMVAGFLVLAISFAGLRFGDVRESVTRGVELSSIDTRADIGSLFSKFNPFGAIENTVWLVEYISANDLSYGGTFAAILTGPIPRFLWSSKPVGGGPYLRNLISPGSYDIVSGEQLTSYSPGIIAESFMNFWAFGLILVAPLFGLVLGLYARLLRSVRSLLGITVWVICLYKLAYILTGEVFATVSSLFQVFIALVLLNVGARLLRFRVYKREQ